MLIHTLNEACRTVFVDMAVLNDELYVQYVADGLVVVGLSVYDTTTFSLLRTLSVPGLGLVRGMASCKRFECVYIGDITNCVVHKVEKNTRITRWPVTDTPKGISVTRACSVLVTCSMAPTIKEFTTDGQLLREIRLQSDITNPRHAVELTADQFVVSHGGDDDSQHRVCLVNDKGIALRSYGGTKGSGIGQLNIPFGLVVVYGSILVSDFENGRVLMLSQTLSYVREVVSGLDGPTALWVDEENCKMYVANNKQRMHQVSGGQVNVYRY